jgi:NAD(P) transhydrogenase
MSDVYDLIVIGSGPAGQRAAIFAAKLGKKVALVESREVVGGACINTGTIPSKTMREAVLHLSGYNYRSIYGMNYRVKERITMADLAFRVQHVIKTEIDVTQAQLSRNNVDMLIGTASFVDATHMKVTNSRGASTYEGRNFVIATGTKPASSAKVPINGRSIINSDQVLEMGNLPRTLIVVGGGVIGVEYTCMFAALGVRVTLIGVEYTCMFAALGVRVTLIERRPHLLEFADQEIVEALSYHLRDARVTMRLNEEVNSVEEQPDGSVVAILDSKKKVQGDTLLYAVGRQGNVEELNLGSIGLEADARGRIPVDKDFRTKCANVFAAGDVIGFPSLASVSMEQGRVAAARAFREDSVVSNPSYYPYGIYTIPEISFIGKTEEQLTEEDVPYEVGVAYYREIARGQIRGDTTGRLKLIFHRETHSILGVHIIGEGASELLHIGQAVMILGGKIEYFIDTVFNYPTLAECYKVAAFNGLNRISKLEDDGPAASGV